MTVYPCCASLSPDDCLRVNDDDPEFVGMLVLETVGGPTVLDLPTAARFASKLRAWVNCKQAGVVAREPEAVA